MARFQAVIEYDGTDLFGFQRQAEGLRQRTVQGEIEGALARIGGVATTVLGAGRTDSGVHATGQVIAFDMDWKHAETDLLRALNANLPRDVAVRSLTVCASDFHPRFQARARRYRYTIYNARVRSPLAARYAWHVWPPALDVKAMQAASLRIVGRCDFAAFGADPDGGENTIRTVSRADWSGEEPWWYLDIQADAFLYRMVRSLVGALKKVGAGDLAVADFAALLESRDRSQGPPVAPAHGLCLMEVIY